MLRKQPMKRSRGKAASAIEKRHPRKRMKRPIADAPNAGEKRHIERIAAMPCLGCGAQPVEVHHSLSAEGKRCRRDHRFVIPLCVACHRGPHGVHGIGSETKFGEGIGIDLGAWAVSEWKYSEGLADSAGHIDGEEWCEIPGFGGHYAASTLGRIKSLPRTVRKRHCVSLQKYGAQFLKGTPDRDGYLRVHLSVEGKKQGVRIHHLVLLAFRGPRPDGALGCHRNGNVTDNRPDNLRWDSHAGNMADRQQHGMYYRGEDHPMAKLSNQQAHDLRNSGLGPAAAALAFGISRSQAHRILNGQRGGAA